MAAETLVLPYNDVAALEAVFAARGDEIACVITEAAAGNMGVVPPAPGFTEALRRVTAAHGALLVSDEVMTGFRVGRAGWWGHEGVDVAPDLMTFGKVMGGGFPAAAFGGRRDVMALLAPEGPVYQAGTLSGNPVATAAGLATLRACDDALYARLGRVSRTIADAASAALSAAGVAHRVQWAGLDVLGVLPRGRGAHLRRRARPGHRRVRAVLPRDARRRRLPAAERVRVVVRLRRARRARGRARPRGPSRRRPAAAAGPAGGASSQPGLRQSVP